MIRAALLAFALLATTASAEDARFDFEADDPEMAEAIAAAQATLGYFFAEAGKDGRVGQAVKVAVSLAEGAGYELLWMDACRPSDSADLACLVGNDGAATPLAKGDLYDVRLDAIADWMFFDEQGRIHGAYTARAMLPRLPEDEAEALRARLAPLPRPVASSEEN